MISTLRHRCRHILAIALLAAMTPTWAVTPTVQPLGRTLTTYAATGTLASISVAKRTLTISGTEYRYLPALRPVSANGSSLTIQDLAPGQSVAYVVDAASIPGQLYVVELRLLAAPGRGR